jgi:hypothetical protein
MYECFYQQQPNIAEHQYALIDCMWMEKIINVYDEDQCHQQREQVLLRAI